MVLLEADDDLAACVKGFFEGRFDVSRVSDLDTALEEIGRADTDVLFAAIDPGAPNQVARIEALRRRHPEIEIVVSYLAPPEQSWENTRLRAAADVVVRKPYRVIDVDRAMSRGTNSANEDPPESGHKGDSQ